MSKIFYTHADWNAELRRAAHALVSLDNNLNTSEVDMRAVYARLLASVQTAHVVLQVLPKLERDSVVLIQMAATKDARTMQQFDELVSGLSRAFPEWRGQVLIAPTDATAHVHLLSVLSTLEKSERMDLLRYLMDISGGARGFDIETAISAASKTE